MNHRFLKYEYNGETYCRSNIHVSTLTDSIFLDPCVFLITTVLFTIFLHQKLNEIINDCLLRMLASLVTNGCHLVQEHQEKDIINSRKS